MDEVRAYLNELGRNIEDVKLERDTILASNKEDIKFWLKDKVRREGEPTDQEQIDQICADGEIKKPIIIDLDADYTVEGRHRLTAALKCNLDVPVIMISSQKGHPVAEASDAVGSGHPRPASLQSIPGAWEIFETGVGDLIKNFQNREDFDSKLWNLYRASDITYIQASQMMFDMMDNNLSDDIDNALLDFITKLTGPDDNSPKEENI